MDTTASFLYICILITFVDYPHAAPLPQHVSVREGDTAVLPCKISNMLDVLYEMPHVKWEVSTKSVFERLGEKTSTDKEFEGRAKVALDELLNGNCSLVLEDVRKSDAGDYKSNLMVNVNGSKMWRDINNIKLSVEDGRMIIEKLQSGEAGLKCPHSLILIIALIVCLLFSH